MDAKIGGQIHGISLPSVLQMYEMEKTTCTLKISSENRVGYLYLLKGELIDAELEDLRNEEAAFEVISWDESVIEIEEKISKTQKKIQMPLMNIMMEGLRIKDERAAKMEKTPEKKAKPGKPLKTKKEEKAKPVEPPPIVQEESPKEMEEIQLEMEVPQQMPPEEKISEEKPPEEKSIVPEETEPEIGIAVEEKKEAIEKPDSQKEKKEVSKKVKKKISPEKKRSNKKIFVTIVIAALIICGVFLWISVVSPILLEREFDKLQAGVTGSSTLEQKEGLLKEYLDTHYNNIYIPKIEEQIKNIRTEIDKRDYENAIQNVGNLKIDSDFREQATSVYRQYLTRHPDGLYIKEIKEKIAMIPGIIDDYEFETLKNIDKFEYDKRIGAYNDYLKFHADGKHVKKVRKMRSDMHEIYYNYLKKEISSCDKEKRWERCISLCETFLDNFQQGSRTKRVSKFKNQMRGKSDFIELKQNATDKGKDYFAARAIYAEYLEEHPNTYVKGKIKYEISRLDKKIKIKEDWEDVSMFCTNKRNNVLDRIDRMNRYLDKNPNTPYLSHSKKIMKQLEREKLKMLLYLEQLEEDRKNEELRQLEIAREKARIQVEKEDMIEEIEKSGDRFTIKGDDVIVDTNTGLMWCLLDSQSETGRCMTYDGAKYYVENLDAGGYTDWRLPTANDLLVIYLNRPAFPSGEADWYWSSKAIWKGSHEMVEIVTRVRRGFWKKSEASEGKCGTVRAVRP